MYAHDYQRIVKVDPSKSEGITYRKYLIDRCVRCSGKMGNELEG